MKASIMAERPRTRRDLLLQDAGREGLVYDRDGEVLHILNVTALEVWRACDGTNDLKTIESVLTSRFSGVTAAQAAGDIAEIVAEFGVKGLLETGTEADGSTESDERLDSRPQRLK